MTKIEFRKLIFEDKKGNYNSPFELKKMSDICDILKQDECDLIALEIATKFDKNIINLKNLIDFVKSALITNAVFLAEKTEILNSSYLSRFEEKQALKAFYFKKALKRMPKWMQKAILGNDDE